MVDAFVEVFHLLFDLVAEGAYLCWGFHIYKIRHSVSKRIQVNVGVWLKLWRVSPTIFIGKEPSLDVLLDSWKEGFTYITWLSRTEVTATLDVLTVETFQTSDNCFVYHVLSLRKSCEVLRPRTSVSPTGRRTSGILRLCILHLVRLYLGALPLSTGVNLWYRCHVLLHVTVVYFIASLRVIGLDLLRLYHFISPTVVTFGWTSLGTSDDGLQAIRHFDLTTFKPFVREVLITCFHRCFYQG